MSSDAPVRRWRSLYLIVALAVAFGCSCSQPCQRHSDCASGMVCQSGVCILPAAEDGGQPADAGAADAPADAAPGDAASDGMPDAPPADAGPADAGADDAGPADAELSDA